MAVVKLADVIVPAIFTPYSQLRTAQKSALIQSGIVSRDQSLDTLLAGAGLTFNIPSWNDLADVDENVSSDDDTAESAPNKLTAVDELGVRLSRNNSWSSMRLVSALLSQDPMAVIGDLVADYWVRRLQACFISSMMGVFANNATATDVYHVQNDLTNDISGAGPASSATEFSAEAFIDTCTLLGDGAASVTTVMMHSVVYARAQKNNLIDFIPDARGEIDIPTFLGRRVIVDDQMPNPAGRFANQTSTGVYHSWLLGPSAVRYGVGQAEVPTEILRVPAAGNGAGQDILFSRVEWMVHPVGHAFSGTPAKGGPSNAATANNLANASSWTRVFPERKQIRIARLISRES